MLVIRQILILIINPSLNSLLIGVLKLINKIHKRQQILYWLPRSQIWLVGHCYFIYCSSMRIRFPIQNFQSRLALLIVQIHVIIIIQIIIISQLYLCLYLLVYAYLLLIKLSQFTTSMSQNVQPHQQDDCQDCQKERAENNQLIDFYERVHKLKAKVSQIKPQIQNHSTAYKDQRLKLQKIATQINNPVTLSADVDGLDSKQMGYQLACALLQREIKMKRQNQLMSKRIRQLKTTNETVHQSFKKSIVAKKDSEMQSQPHIQTMTSSKLSQFQEHYKGPNNKIKQSISVFSDSLDSALEDKSFWGTNQISPIKSQRAKQDNSRYSQDFSLGKSQKNSSTFSSFQETGRSVFNPSQDHYKNKFQNLNLWLYQYNVEEQPPINKNIKTKQTKLSKYK